MQEDGLLLLGANQFQRERALIGAEKCFDGKIITISKAPPFIVNKYPLITVCSDEGAPSKLCQDVLAFIGRSGLKLKAVIPLNDFVLNAGFAVAQHFGLPYHSKSTIDRSRHKDKIKQTLSAAGLPVVQSLRFSGVEQAQSLAKEIGYPLVIKPLDFGGSGGVVKVESPQQLQQAIRHTQQHLARYSVGVDATPNQMVMEPYIISQREISVEVINAPDFRSVIGITDKYLGDEPYFSEVAHCVPSSIYDDGVIVEKIEQFALTACAALDIKYGMAHVEMKIGSAGEIVVLEVGARTAGDGIMDLYEKAMGVNLYRLHCLSYLGELTKDDIPQEFLNTAAVGYLTPRDGVIEQINKDNLSAADLNNVDSIVVKAEVGAMAEAAKDWSTRYGFVEYTLWQHQGRESFDVLQSTERITSAIFSIKARVACA